MFEMRYIAYRRYMDPADVEKEILHKHFLHPE